LYPWHGRTSQAHTLDLHAILLWKTFALSPNEFKPTVHLELSPLAPGSIKFLLLRYPHCYILETRASPQFAVLSTENPATNTRRKPRHEATMRRAIDCCGTARPLRPSLMGLLSSYVSPTHHLLPNPPRISAHVRKYNWRSTRNSISDKEELSLVALLVYAVYGIRLPGLLVLSGLVRWLESSLIGC